MTKLARLLLDRDITVAWLVKETGIARSTLHEIVLGTRRMKNGEDEKIAKALGVTVNDIMDYA